MPDSCEIKKRVPAETDTLFTAPEGYLRPALPRSAAKPVLNYSWLIAPDGQAPAHVPQSMQESASISYLPSPALIAPTGHSPSQVPQLIHSSEITYAIGISSFKIRLLQNAVVLYSLFYTRLPPISSGILRKMLVKLYYFQSKIGKMCRNSRRGCTNGSKR